MKILIRISFLLLFLSTAAQAQYFSSFSNLQIFTNIDGKIGFKDSLGNVIVEPKYQQVGCPFDGLQLVSRNGKFGYINSLGVEVVEAIYDNLSGRSFYNKPSPYSKAKINGKYGIINIHNGDVLIPIKYENIESIGSNFYAAKKDGLYGVVSLSGTVRIPFKYARIESIGSNFYAAQKDGLYGIVSLSGAELTPFIYSHISYFGDNIIPVEIDNKKCGVIDTTNRTIIEPSEKFKYISSFINGLSVFISDKGKYGVINKKSEIIIPAIYDDARINTRISRVIVKQGDKEGVISYENRIIIPIIYNRIKVMPKSHFFGGGGTSEEIWNGTIYYVESDGYISVPSNYLLAEKDQKQTLFNADGKKIIDGMDKIESLWNLKFIKVVNNGHLGLYDSLGNNIVPVNYMDRYEIIKINDDRSTQSNDIDLMIYNKNKVFIIFTDQAYTRTKEYYNIKIIKSDEEKGKYVIGFIVVGNNKEGVIDRNGKIIIPVKYDYINTAKEENGNVIGFFVENGKKKGVIDRNGKIIIPVKKYDKIKTAKDKNGKITGYTMYLNDKETFYKLP